MSADIVSILNHIDPGCMPYEEWLAVGMALKAEGESCGAWDSWSAKDATRYRPGVCERKWASFQGDGVTLGTLVEYAKKYGGYVPPSFAAVAYDDWTVTVNNPREDTAPSAPQPDEWNPAHELSVYLSALFQPDEFVGYVTESFTSEDGRAQPKRGSYSRTAGDLLRDIEKHPDDIGAAIGDYDPEVGAWIRFNPLDGQGVKNENVTAFRYALVESDKQSIERQAAIYAELELPVAVLVHSGNKSLHAIIRVGAQSKEEYRERVQFLYKVCAKAGLEIDEANKNPSRLSRMPGVIRNGQKQYIVATNQGRATWEEWRGAVENAPLAPEEWEEPCPLEGEAPPAWPEGLLPEPVEAFAKAVAASLEVPLALPASMALGILSVAVQGRYVVNIKPSYFEPVNLYWLCALEPGTRKTAVLSKCRAPLLQWERERRDAMADSRAKAESEAKTLAKRIEHLRANAGKAPDDDAAQEIQTEIERLEGMIPMIPPLPRLMTTNCTAEHLATMMTEQHERMAVVSDEGGQFEVLAGMYSKGVPNLDLVLQSHIGSYVSQDRGSRPPAILEHPTLTLALCPQPEVVAALGAKPGFTGRGLVARFLYLLPDSPIGGRNGHGPDIPDEVLQRWNSLVSAMLDHECPKDSKGRPEPGVLRLSAGAFAVWDSFQGECERLMAPGGPLEHMRDWGGKLPGGVARIAGVCHCAMHAYSNPAGYDISEATMAKAVEIGRLLIPHAMAAYALMLPGKRDTDAAKLIHEWIRREHVEAFTRRTLMRATGMHARFPSAKRLDGPLEALESTAWIRKRPAPIGAARRLESFEVNPFTHNTPGMGLAEKHSTPKGI